MTGPDDELRALALLNYGHFTTFVVEGGAVRGLALHLDRLIRDCRTLFDSDLDPDAVRARVREHVSAHSSGTDGPLVVRVTVVDPGLNLAHPASARDPRLMVTSRPAPSTPAPPLRVRSTRYVRDVPQVKHVGLFGALHRRREAQRAGFDDALFVDADGHIAEGPTWNIAVVLDGRVVWPKAASLPGVTMRLLGADDADATSRPVTLAEAASATAAFATSAAGVREISALDDTVFPGAPTLLNALRHHYAETRPQPL